MTEKFWKKWHNFQARRVLIKHRRAMIALYKRAEAEKPRRVMAAYKIY